MPNTLLVVQCPRTDEHPAHRWIRAATPLPEKWCTGLSADDTSPSDPRGAASVTLDTIITEALLAYYDVIPMNDQDGIADIQAAAGAVTDALLAKGRTAYETDGVVYVIPLEAS